MSILINTFLSNTLDTSTTPYKVANSNTAIYGGSGTDHITINSGVLGTKVASTIENVTLSGALADYKFKQGFGSNLEVYDGSDNFIATITDVDTKKLSFGDGALNLTYANDKISVGGTEITTTAATVTPTLTVAKALELDDSNSTNTYDFKVIDTSANINTKLSELLTDNDVVSIDSSENDVAINIVYDTSLTKLQANDTIVVVDTGANIATLINDSDSNPIDTKIDKVDASDDALSITYTEFTNVTSAKLTSTDAITVTTIADATDLSSVDLSNVDTLKADNGDSGSAVTVTITSAQAATLGLIGSSDDKFNITADSGNNVFQASVGNDTIDGGDGNDIIRGGAGVDTIDGGAGDDTFVVLGTIDADDYAESDVTNTTGAYALGLASTIDADLDTSDSGTDGTGETYDGGDGTNSIEIWGEADLSKATLTNINAINTHSTLNIKDTQLKSLFTGNGSAVNLNLLDDDSTINIIGSQTANDADGNSQNIISTDTGLSILTYFKTGIDQTSAAADNFDPTISFWMDSLDDGVARNYKIQKEDIIPTADDSGNWTYTDNADENSVVAVIDNTTADATTTINAGNGLDIVVMDIGVMDSTVTVDGGADMDILVYLDTNSATNDLDNVTNTEIVYFLDGEANIAGASVVTKDTLVAEGATLVVAAEDLEDGGLTWDGSAEQDGSFTIWGSAQADTLTGGAKDDTFKDMKDTDTIDGGDNDAVDRANNKNGDIAIFSSAVSKDNLEDAGLANIETIVVTDIGSDATETYDFSAQTEALFITVQAGKDSDGNDITNGVTIAGGSGNDTINLGAGDDTIVFAGGSDIIVGFKANGTDKLNVNYLLSDGDIDSNASDFQAFDGTATATDNNIVNFTSSAALSTDNVKAKFETSDSDNALMVLGNGEQVIFVNQDDDADNGDDYDAQIFLVDNTDNTITATLVGTIHDATNSSSLAFGDFA